MPPRTCLSLIHICLATCQGTTNALIHLAAALPLNIVAILLVAFLQPVASVVFTAVLPLCSALCYAVFTARAQNLAMLKATLVARVPRAAQAKRCLLYTSWHKNGTADRYGTISDPRNRFGFP